MPDWLSITLLLALGLYTALGSAFAAWFLTRGLRTLDPVAAHAPLTFRLIIAPGVIALWPVLCRRLLVAPRSEASA